MPWQNHIVVAESELASATANQLETLIGQALEERGSCHLAVSGGRTPRAAFELLASCDLAWSAVHVWQVDERIAPDGDPQRNANDLIEALIEPTGATAHLMPVIDPDPTAACTAYALALETACGGVLDVVHLGLGADGHTASWVPDDEGPIEAAGDVALTTGLYQGTRRMTLTPRCVNRARARIMAVGGADKAEAVATFLRGVSHTDLRASTAVPIPALHLSPLTTVIDATGSSALSSA